MSDRVKVEVHPASALLEAAGGPAFRRWRVMLDGMQHSVHETDADADQAATTLRQRLADGWLPARAVR